MNLEQAREFKDAVTERMQAAKELTEKQYAIGEEILDEREAQDQKWGANRHMPNGTGPEGFHEHITGVADKYRLACQAAAADGTLSWRHIFLEEVFEAAAEGDPEKLRAELIQCMAVGMAWVEDLDRGQK